MPETRQALTYPENEAELLERLSRPGPELVELFARLEQGVLVLGAGGKMGPSLCLLARRAAQEAGRPTLPVVAVSRFSDAQVAEELDRAGVQVVRADLSQDDAWGRLPRLENVIWMVGHKFSRSDPPGTYWVRNVCLVEKLRHLRPRRVVALSSGNVYPFVRLGEPAATEQTEPQPRGEYAVTVWGREQVLRHLAATCGCGVQLVRLNYAVELRYGVLVDLARMILQGQAVPLSVPEVNLVWQGYANAVLLRLLEHAREGQAEVLNLTGPRRLRVRWLANELAQRLGKPARFQQPEGQESLVANASRCHRLFGLPEPPVEVLLDWTARWVGSGQPVWDKPTKFWVSSGRF